MYKGKIVIIDYGAGNLASVKNMFKKVGASNVVISSLKEDIASADKLLLPGVGKFDYGMKKLHEAELVEPLSEAVMVNKKPILGICLGAQLMTEGSEEGQEKGLGWVKGRTVKFDKSLIGSKLKVPHMGWNYVEDAKKSSLFVDMPEEPRFYFVHSYHLKMDTPQDVWLTTHYGYDFCAAYSQENIYACQFHPEKSHKFGMKIIENFSKL